MMKTRITAFICMLTAALIAASCAGGQGKTGESGDPGESLPAASERESVSESESAPEKVYREVSETELLEELRSTPYKSDVTCGDFGLTAPYDTGADRAAFDRVLYPVPESGFKAEYAAADRGVTVDGAKNSAELNKLLSSLKEIDGLKKIEFGAGVYKFDSTIELAGLEDVYLVGKDSVFCFTEWCVAFSMTNCKNVHFNGISVDYDPSPVVSGEVTACDKDAGTVSIKLYDEFDLTPSRYDGGKIKYGSYMEFAEGEFGELYPDPDGNLLYNSTGDKVTNILGGSYDRASNVLTLTFRKIKKVAAGVKVSVAFTMYEFETYSAKNCEDLYFDDCNVFCSAGMTFHFTTVRNCYMNNTDLRLREGSKRLMTATADGFHGNDCTGDLFITGSIYENSHDDSVNICSFYKNISSNYAREIVCSSSVYTNYPIEEGDVIEVYDPADFSFHGRYTVKEVSKSLATYTLSVDKFIKDDLSGLILGNVTRSPHVVIKDCIFRNKRNRGILLQSRNCEIANNCFYNIIHGALSVHSVLDIFAEAIVPGDVKITGNKFIHDNYAFGLEGDVSVFAYGNTGKPAVGSIRNIEVSENFIADCGQAGVSFKATGDCSAKNNLFFNASARCSREGLCAAVRSVTGEGLTVVGNVAVAAASDEKFALLKEDDDDFGYITQISNREIRK